MSFHRAPLTHWPLKDPPEIVVWIWIFDTFNNNSGIDLTKYLKEKFWYWSYWHLSFRYFSKYTTVCFVSPKYSFCCCEHYWVKVGYLKSPSICFQPMGCKLLSCDICLHSTGSWTLDITGHISESLEFKCLCYPYVTVSSPIQGNYQVINSFWLLGSFPTCVCHYISY